MTYIRHDADDGHAHAFPLAEFVAWAGGDVTARVAALIADQHREPDDYPNAPKHHPISTRGSYWDSTRQIVVNVDETTPDAWPAPWPSWSSFSAGEYWGVQAFRVCDDPYIERPDKGHYIVDWIKLVSGHRRPVAGG